MSKPNYLLLGWKPKRNPNRPSGITTRGSFKGHHDRQELPGRIIPLANGNTQTVIAAACAADCGVLLFDCVVQITPK